MAWWDAHKEEYIKTVNAEPPILYRSLDLPPLPARAFFSAVTSQQKNKLQNPPTQQLCQRENESGRVVSRCIRVRWELDLQSGIRSTDTLTGCKALDRECAADSTVWLMPCRRSDPPRSPQVSSQHAPPAESKCCTGTAQEADLNTVRITALPWLQSTQGVKTALPTTNPHWNRVVCAGVCLFKVHLNWVMKGAQLKCNRNPVQFPSG